MFLLCQGWKNLQKTTHPDFLGFMGFFLGLFWVFWQKKRKKTDKIWVLGMKIQELIILYIFIYDTNIESILVVAPEYPGL